MKGEHQAFGLSLPLARPAGFEPATSGLENLSVAGEQSQNTDSRVLTERGEPQIDGLGVTSGVIPDVDPIEAALAMALEKATAASRWDVVAQLVGEIKTRREARLQVVSLDDARKRKGGAG